MAVTQYCTWTDVARRLSAAGAALRVDDDPGAKKDVLDEAALEVNEYVQKLYPDLTELATSPWITKQARSIAVYLACLRRNQPVPKSVQAEYDKTIKALERVRQGSLLIPDIASPAGGHPVLSNLHPQRGPVNEVKVVTGTSTGGTAPYQQFTDNRDPIDYSL